MERACSHTRITKVSCIIIFKIHNTHSNHLHGNIMGLEIWWQRFRNRSPRLRIWYLCIGSMCNEIARGMKICQFSMSILFNNLMTEYTWKQYTEHSHITGKYSWKTLKPHCWVVILKAFNQLLLDLRGDPYITHCNNLDQI